MKMFSLLTTLILSLAITSVAYARDTQYMLPIKAALSTPDAQQKLDGKVKFYFGNQKHPAVLARLDTDVTNRKTNAFGKSDTVACNWAFLSAMLALQNRAHELGANAVINITSYYKKKTVSSNSEFECHAGAMIAGVALKGDFVKVAGK